MKFFSTFLQVSLFFLFNTQQDKKNICVYVRIYKLLPTKEKKN